MMKKKFNLQDVIRPKQTVYYTQVKQPVYNKRYYINDLRKNYIECGLDPRRVDAIDKGIPELTDTKMYKQKDKDIIQDFEKIFLILKYEGDRVKVELNTRFLELYEKYYSNGKNPPIETKVEAYKSVGYSDEFIENMIVKSNKIKKDFEKIEKMIEKIFEKEPTKKIIRKKKIIQEDPEEEEEEEEQEEEEPGEILEDEDQEDDDEIVEEDVCEDLDDD